jgi:MOSC domain-containing protein
MAMTIAAIYRYPVKGLSAELLQRVALMPGECLPQDRRFAIALASTRFDPHSPQWLAKSHFVMLMRDEKLARLKTAFDPATDELTIETPSETPGEAAGAVALRACLGDPEGCRRVSEFLADFLGSAVERPLRVVEAPGHAFADSRKKPGATSDKYISLVNRASIAALEGVVRAPIDPRRFRANVYVEGPPAWSELGWIGSEIAAGGARLRVIAAITRCAATEVNPATAERDLAIPAALQRHFGHNLMGIYAEVVAGGDIATGDALVLRPI